MSDQNSGFQIAPIGRRQLFSAVFDRIFFLLAGNDEILENLDEFEIRPDSNKNTAEVAALERWKKSP